MAQIRIKRSFIPNSSPPNGLAPGELAVAVDAAAVPRLWVGVPAETDPDERRLIAGDDIYLPLTGGRLSGPLQIHLAPNVPPLAQPPVAGTPYLWAAGVDGGDSYMVLDGVGGRGTEDAPSLMARRARGSYAAPQALLARDVIFSFTSIGAGTSGYSNEIAGSFALAASENWSDTAQGSIWSFLCQPTGAPPVTGSLLAMTVQPERVHVFGDCDVDRTISAESLHVRSSALSGIYIEARNTPDPDQAFSLYAEQGTIRYWDEQLGDLWGLDLLGNCAIRGNFVAGGNISGASLTIGGAINATAAGTVFYNPVNVGPDQFNRQPLNVFGQLYVDGAIIANPTGGSGGTDLYGTTRMLSTTQMFGNVSIASPVGTISLAIDWNAVGVAPPSALTRSEGAKLVLFPSLGPNTCDYGLGIEGGTLWYAGGAHRWYNITGPTALMSLDGGGNLQLLTGNGSVGIGGKLVPGNAFEGNCFNSSFTGYNYQTNAYPSNINDWRYYELGRVGEQRAAGLIAFNVDSGDYSFAVASRGAPNTIIAWQNVMTLRGVYAADLGLSPYSLEVRSDITTGGVFRTGSGSLISTPGFFNIGGGLSTVGIFADAVSIAPGLGGLGQLSVNSHITAGPGGWGVIYQTPTLPGAGYGFAFGWNGAGGVYVTVNGLYVGYFFLQGPLATADNISVSSVDALAAVEKLDFRSFDHGDRRVELGLLPQQVRAAMPAAVSDPPPDVEAEPMLDPQALNAYALRAIQQLAQRLDALETRINAGPR